jgi:hypothetical protein
MVMAMELRVKFEAGERSRAIEVPNRALGLGDVDKIRTELGIPDLDCRGIRSFSIGLFEDPEIMVPEKVARMSGRFERTHLVVVRVSLGCLNPYTYEEIVPEMSRATGGVVDVVIRVRASEDQILAAWLEAGAPLEWRVEREGEGKE